VPTLTAVNGPAVGAGMNFALACAVIIAAESARFDPRFLDVGIHPGGGHLWRLQARAGRQAAAAMVLFGEALTGPDAVTHGLAWTCVPDGAAASRSAARSRPDNKAADRAEGPDPVSGSGPSAINNALAHASGVPTVSPDPV
jgi:enoyl-CoA hydratase/carnithine racemase